MNIETMVRSFDDDALVALANRGLLRRAQKATGDAKITSATDTSAEISVADQTVHIPVQGPLDATCTCPATGVCSHVLTAMLVLRNHETTVSMPIADASAQLAEINAEVLQKFSGADYAKASVLAGAAQIEDRGATVVVGFSAPEASVTFVADQPIDRALYKGPVTRKRLVIAAGAIAIRDQQGIARETPHQDHEAALTQEHLEDISAALEDAIGQVFQGSAAIAQERLLDLAISARVQSAPRLMGQLSTLSTQAGWAHTGDIRFDGGQFLAALARAFALGIALTNRPSDPALLGDLRRNYAPTETMDLCALGAKTWFSPNGARGLTLYLLELATGEYYTASLARAAGKDPSFSPQSAYRVPLWTGPTVEQMTGRLIRLTTPYVTTTGQISISDKSSAEIISPLETAQIANSPALFREWDILRTDLTRRLGQGMSRGSFAVPALIEPAYIDEPRFDDISQRYQWDTYDGVGKTLTLSAAVNDIERLRHLHHQFPSSTAVLIQATQFGDTIQFEPVTVLVQTAKGLVARNVDFTDLPEPKMVSRTKDGIRRSVRRLRGRDPVTASAGFHSQLLGHLATQASHAQPEQLRHLARASEARGHLLLATCLDELANAPTPSTLLAAAYLAQELELSLALSV